jgi:hypothetical protein
MRIEVEPVIGDGAIYYRTTIAAIEADSSGASSSTVRDVFHTDTPEIALEVLSRVIAGDRGAD